MQIYLSVKIYATVKKKIHTLSPSFVEICPKMTRVKLFKPRQPPLGEMFEWILGDRSTIKPMVYFWWGASRSSVRLQSGCQKITSSSVVHLRFIDKPVVDFLLLIELFR